MQLLLRVQDGPCRFPTADDSRARVPPADELLAQVPTKYRLQEYNCHWNRSPCYRLEAISVLANILTTRRRIRNLHQFHRMDRMGRMD